MRLVIDIKLGPGLQTFKDVINLLLSTKAADKQLLAVEDFGVLTDTENEADASKWEVVAEENDYTEPVDEDADLMTVAEFKACVERGLITDEDGSGLAVREGRAAPVYVDINNVPHDATHVAWYNK